MKIVLDSNEYIYCINKENLLPEKLFLDKNQSILIDDQIIREVLRNIDESQKKEFYSILFKYDINFYGLKIPVHLLNKYRNLGLKKGDIAIAAFCEAINAEYLISENRHFLKGIKNTKFKIVTIVQFLKKIVKE